MKTTSEIHETDIQKLYSKIINLEAQEFSQSEIAFLALFLQKVADLSVEIAKGVPDFWEKQVTDDPLLWILLGMLITELKRNKKSIESRMEIVDDDEQESNRVAHA